MSGLVLDHIAGLGGRFRNSQLEEGREHRVVRIDGDDVRVRIPGYIGSNSYLFQGAISIIVDRIQDHVLHHSQSFVLDSTFSHYPKALENIRRSLDKKRNVIIFYLFQLPEVAWKFTKAREKKEGRHISRRTFIDAFFGAKDTTNRIYNEFQNDISVFFVKKDFLKNEVENIVLFHRGDSIDKYIQKEYTKESLWGIL